MLVLTIAIVFGAALAQSTFGFGSALIAMPLLTVVLGLPLATPLFGLLGATLSLLVVVGDWRHVTWASVWQLAIATGLGIPCGVLLLKFAPTGVIVRGLGIFLLGFSAYRLRQWPLPRLDAPYWPYVCGFTAGVLGGAYNTNGPPIVLYGTAQRWTPTQFRATLQGYFLPSGLIVAATHAIAGLWQVQVIQLYVYCLPAVLGGLIVGQMLNQRLRPAQFDVALSWLLAALGSLLIWRG